MDLTWVAANLMREICGWRVLADVESLSDHRYILVEFGRSSQVGSRQGTKKKYNRWSRTRFCEDRFAATLVWHCATLVAELPREDRPADTNGTVENDQAGRNVFGSLKKGVQWVNRTFREVCDSASTRLRGPSPRKQAYWWSAEIADLRTATIEAQRAWTRAKARRNMSEEELQDLAVLYTSARRAFRYAINEAKNKCWRDLVESIEKDPWGLPYKLVLGRLRQSAPCYSETLEPCVVAELVASLFPTGEPYATTAEECEDME